VFGFGNTSTFVPRDYVKAPNSETGDRFGTSVVLSADGNTLAVGAIGEGSAARRVNDTTVVLGDNSANGAGAVYVFGLDDTNNTRSFAFPDYVKASNSEAGDFFGVAVALGTNGNTLVVGASWESSAANGINDTTVDQSDNSAKNSGAVYVYDRAGNTKAFVFRDYVKAPNSEIRDFFGSAIALSAEGNILAVGATSEDSAARGVNDTKVGQSDNNASSTGAVYIYVLNDTNSFAFRAYVKAPNSEAGDFFGTAVALGPDGNILAVGAYFEDSAASGVNDTVVGQGDNSVSRAGAVYLY